MPDVHPPEDYLLDVEPWERQPNEADLPWEAFRAFRDLEPPRTLIRLHQHFVDQGVNRDAGRYRKWSSTWKWTSRVRAYEIHLERIRQRAHENAIKDMSEKHARMAQAGLSLIAQRLLGNAQAGVDKVDMNHVEFRDVISGLSALVKLERVARGEPAERVSSELTGPGGGPVLIAPVVPEPEVDPDHEINRVRGILARLEEAGAVSLPADSAEPGRKEIEATTGGDGGD